MRIALRPNGVSFSRLLRDSLKRRLRFALARYGEHIGGVTMRFWALATPTQTGQKRCQIEAELKLPKTLKAENTHADVLVAVDRAANRLARAIIREVTVNETALASASVAKPGAGPVRPRRPLLATKKAKRETMRRKEQTSGGPGTKAKIPRRL